MITSDNWTHCHYNSPKLRAFVSLGADPSPEGSELIYIVNLTDHEHKEVYIEDHTTLEEAIIRINDRYGHWEFVDGSAKGEGGCSSCQAH